MGSELEPMEYCPACEEWSPLRDFERPSAAKRGKAFVCCACQDSGREPADPMPDLPPKYRQLLLDLMTCGSVAEAARQNDLCESYVRSLIRGKLPGKQAEQVAAAWQLLLESEGLDLPTIARVSKLLLHAMMPKWNPEAVCTRH